MDAGAAVCVGWGGAVGGEGDEQGDEGFLGGVGGVVVGEEGYRFAGAAVVEVGVVRVVWGGREERGGRTHRQSRRRRHS